MPTFTLTDQEFQQLVNVVANAAVPWVVSNPLLVKLGSQSQQSQQSPVLMRGNAHGDSDSDAQRGAAGAPGV